MNHIAKRKVYKKKRWILPAIIIAALIVLRLMLPGIVKNHVNKVLSDIPGYHGQVSDIDIALYRGAYVIHGFYLNKMDAETEVPFLNFPETDISIEWKSIFKGRIVSEIYMYDPEVIYMQQDMSGDDGTTEEDWSKALTDLIPIKINHLEIQRGKLAFVEATADPTIDIQLNQLMLSAYNLRNVTTNEKKLPSTITGEGTSIGNGKFSIDGKVNIIKEIPDMDIAISLEEVDVTSLNDFSEHHANIDFEKGKAGIFTEIAIADGFLTGYVKVLLEDTKFINKEDSFLKKMWEGFVSFFKYILKNKKNDTFAVKAPLKGNLNNVKTSIWPTIGSVFKNAFISAFESGTDDEIDYLDALEKGKVQGDEKSDSEKQIQNK